jgi:hypothetical protein
LTSGPLTLPAGLRCANEIAVELRDLHQQNRAYGKLSVNNVIMAESGAQLRRCATIGTRRFSNATCRRLVQCSTILTERRLGFAGGDGSAHARARSGPSRFGRPLRWRSNV